MSDKCVIIPAYNEKNNISTVIENISRTTDADIIVIDDGSWDDTAKEARQAGAYVLSHPFNMGYSVALQTGYRFASLNGYRILLQMDADGQHPAAAIPAFFKMVERGESDVVIGSRFLGKTGYQVGFARGAAISLFRWIIRKTTRIPITDPTSGLQCMNRNVFTMFAHDRYLSDYPDTNFIIRLHRLGFSIRELPVDMKKNPDGKSMHKGMFKILYYFFTVFLSIFIALISERQNHGGKKEDQQ